MLIGIFNNLPELVGGVAALAITWMIARGTITWPVIGMKKYRR
jgi:hypothetical protein